MRAFVLGSIFILSLCCHPVIAEVPTLRVAVTHTTDNSGLLARLNPVFEEQTGIRVNTITAGSGQALRLGREGDVDVLLTHAPAAEREFVEQGYALERHAVMYNDYILVGPATDPAAVANAATPAKAFIQIHTAAARFISRGDNSGTHRKELALWQRAKRQPQGDWYINAGTGMGQTLLLASDKQAYTLSDRGTWLAFKERLNLVPLFQASSALRNPYHVLAVNPDMHPTVRADLAAQYILFLTGPAGQTIIADYKIEGQSLFHPVRQPQSGEKLQQSARKSGNFLLDAMVSAFKLILDVDKELYFVVWTSLKVSLLAVLLASLISIPLGIIVALNRFRGKHLLLACLNTLMALPTVVVGLLMYGLLNRQGVFGEYGLLYTPAAIVIGQCVLIVPVVWNLSIAAVNAADPRLARTCSSLGASFFQRCLIYMSEVRFALIAAVVTGFGRAIGEVGIAMMLGGNIAGFTRTMTTAIALETSKGEFEFALALGFMLLIVAFVVNTVLQQFQVRKR